jgi:hypothetical protein
MISMPLPRMNGSSSHAEHTWLRQNVQQFFNDFNWEDNSLDIQEWMQATATGEQPLSLTLKVKQFFEAVNWDCNAIGSVSSAQPAQPDSDSPSSSDTFTLDDFSDLF